MEHLAGQLCCGVEPRDGIALAGAFRVAGGGQHHADGRAWVPVTGYLVQLAIQSGFAEFHEVALQTAEHGLGFRVAEAAVELQHVGRAVVCHHQARIEEAGVGRAFRREPAHGGQDHFVHGARVHCRRDHGRGRIRAHAARVGAGVTIAHALVVLRSGQRQYVLAIHHDDEAGFFAFQKLFHHHLVAGRTKRPGEHLLDGGDGFFLRGADDHALAGGEAVCFHHQRRTLCTHPGGVEVRTREDAVGGSGNVVAFEEVFGEGLGAFELRGGLTRAEAAEARGRERIHHTDNQRLFRAHDRQRHAFGLCQRHQAGHVVRGHRHVAALRFGGGAGVARRDQYFADARRLGQFPGQRVFASTTTNHHHFHRAASWKAARQRAAMGLCGVAWALRRLSAGSGARR